MCGGYRHADDDSSPSLVRRYGRCFMCAGRIYRNRTRQRVDGHNLNTMVDCRNTGYLLLQLETIADDYVENPVKGYYFSVFAESSRFAARGGHFASLLATWIVLIACLPGASSSSKEDLFPSELVEFAAHSENPVSTGRGESC